MQYTLKSEHDIKLMRKAGLLTWQAHQVAAKLIKPGVTTGEIDAAVETFFAEHDAIPLFKGVPGKVPFPAVACISVNEQVVHGIPGPRRLQEGDVVSIDLGCRLNGWCGDAAVTWPVGKISDKTQRLLDITEATLKLGIELINKRSRWSEVAREMELFVQKAGYSVVEGLAGHGIGRNLWEKPMVPNYVTRTYVQKEDFELQPGLVIAIEPMVNMGGKRLNLLPDHWTFVASDGKPSAHFEHTIAITKDGPQILTVGPNGEGWAV